MNLSTIRAARALALCAALLVLAAPTGGGPLTASPAQAASQWSPTIPIPPGHLISIELRGSNGYDVLVTANSWGVVNVEAAKAAGSTQYITPGRTVGKLGVRARFRGLGTVAFGFRPAGRPRPVPSADGCRGRQTMQRGVIRGRIKFRAERGFTAVNVRRARAELRRWRGLRCRLRVNAKGSPGLDAQFFAQSEEKPVADFGATRYTPDARPRARRVQFEASALERRGAVRILRSVSVAAGPSSFLQPDPENVPEHLVFTPPAPFSGSASFQRTPESTFTWTGPLQVRFPGTDPLPLTGPHFNGAVCALRGCAANSLMSLFGLYGQRSQFDPFG